MYACPLNVYLPRQDSIIVYLKSAGASCNSDRSYFNAVHSYLFSCELQVSYQYHAKSIIKLATSIQHSR